MTKNKTLTLDDYAYGYDPASSDGDYAALSVKKGDKIFTLVGEELQFFLQWVADEVIEPSFGGLDEWKGDETRTALTRHDVYIQGENQRAILKQHGWKPEGEK